MSYGNNTPYDGAKNTKLAPYDKKQRQRGSYVEDDDMDDDVEDIVDMWNDREVDKCLK